ncbi:hypothetical protein AG1IA_05281 [Rhizoctonia solani AG-1 IA]|uniref:Uncharacterized protein n=1 Tax=Thanatephorus cucumeris (strain AG1-IA) TaxID=983506 RepID=L8WRS2_THACA|nr:hypothetical protein AG1IA_05281 [Rhizoctonia solani AG-1 IA]
MLVARYSTPLGCQERIYLINRSGPAFSRAAEFHAEGTPLALSKYNVGYIVKVASHGQSFSHNFTRWVLQSEKLSLALAL